MSQKLTPAHTDDPIFWPKMYPGGSKKGSKFFLDIFVKKQTSGQTIPNPKKRIKTIFFFSELQELEIQNCVQPNFHYNSDHVIRISLVCDINGA